VQKEIVIVGLNHRSASIEVRESLAFENAYVKDALAQLRAYPSIQEGVILSTCNRVEVVAAASDSQSACADIKRFLSDHKAHRIPGSLEEHVYTYEGREAIRHLFRVAASLDSMVVGEPQILGQLKDHYDFARQAGTVGAISSLVHRRETRANRNRSRQSRCFCEFGSRRSGQANFRPLR